MDTITPTTEAGGPLALMRLLQLASPALPVGAFAYSQGLESAVEAGWVRDAPGAASWIEGILRDGLRCLDLAVAARLHAAWRSGARGECDYWNAFLLAGRESAELREEDERIGAALLRLLEDLGVAAAGTWRGERTPCAFATAFTLAATHWGIARRDALGALAWAWAENQVAAAVKLVPLGQTDGQRILLQLGAVIPAVCDSAQALEEDALGQTLPGLVHASIGHETQYSRLFRS